MLFKHTFSNFMADICKAGQTTGWYTAHSLNATSIQALNNQGFEARHIMFMPGHRSEASLKSYSRTPSMMQKKQLSSTLSSLTLDPKQCKMVSPSTATSATICPSKTSQTQYFSAVLSPTTLSTLNSRNEPHNVFRLR